MNFGYMRVSTDRRDADTGEYVQSFDLQRDALVESGIPVDRIYQDRASGMKQDRPGLAELLSIVQEGDAIVVWKLDRLGRSARDLLNVAHELKEKGVSIRSIQDGVDTSGALGSFLLTILGAVAELERENIRDRVRAGMASAKSQGIGLGRKHAMSPTARADAARAYAEGESMQSIARRYRVSRQTVFRVIQKDAAV